MRESSVEGRPEAVTFRQDESAGSEDMKSALLLFLARKRKKGRMHSCYQIERCVCFRS